MIRVARADDFPAIAAITNHYITNTAIHFGYDPVTADELRAQVEHYPWLVDDDGGVLRGFAKAGPWRARAAYRWTCETGIYLAPDAHGRGRGTALYAQLIDAVKQAGFHSIVAGVTLPNDASLALHQRLGFVDAGVVRQAGFKHERWHDVAFFQLIVAGS
jgi:phosphinothricin acetyltransferase